MIEGTALTDNSNKMTHIAGSMLCFSRKERKRKKKVGPAHVQCVNVLYDGNGPARFYIPLHKIPWSRSLTEYLPTQYTSYDVLRQPKWADPPLDSPRVSLPCFNELKNNIDRRSYHGLYKLQEGVPRNPIGRTGMIGRGVLGRWGPNHTATPIITRWSRDSDNKARDINGKRVLEVVVVRSRMGWALPCELVVPGDRLGLGTKRAFLTELVRNKSYTAADEVNKSLSLLFEGGNLIYQGYVDDAKNTDNAWLETIATNFHDETGEKFGSYRLAADFCWVEAQHTINIFSQHMYLLRDVVEVHRAHW